MKHFDFSKLKKAVLAGLTCSVFLFGSVAQTVFAENGFANFENRKQISSASVNTNASQREARNKNRNDKLSGLQERRNEAKPAKPQANNNKTEINNENSNNYNISAAGDVVIGTMHKDSHNDNSVNINNSKNDNRVYDSSINNSEIDNSTNKGATVNSHNTTNSHNTKNSNNISVSKNGSGQTRANGAGAVNVGKNDNANGARGVNAVKTQTNSTNKNTVSNQNVVVKKNTAVRQNVSVKKNGTNGTSSNVQSNATKNNTMTAQRNNNPQPSQPKNNAGVRNGGHVNNANNAQRTIQNNQTTINNKNSNSYNIGADGDVVIGEMYKDSHDNNSVNIDNSVNDNRVYDKSINNSKIDSSVNKGATIDSRNTENSHNVTDSGNVKVEINEPVKDNINHDPQGKLDEVEYKGVNQLYVKGWAYDEDDMNSPVTVEFRVGSETGVLLSKATANKFYSNEIKNHGFEETYTVNLVNKYYGWQTVYAIAKNIGNNGKDQKIGEGRINIVIPSPDGSATISDPDTSRRIKITGWTNTERIEYIVAGTTRTININNPSYTTKNFEEYYTLPQEINGQIQVQVYAVDTTNHYAKKSIGNRSIVIKKPIPQPDGQAKSSYEEKGRRLTVSGWTNTERVEYVVAGTTRTINISNPDHISQNFEDTYVLPNGISGTQTVEIYAVDTTNTYPKKKIGTNTFRIPQWVYTTLPNGWYKIVSAETAGVWFEVEGDTISEGKKVYASASKENANKFYLQNLAEKYFTLESGLSEFYLAIPEVDCAKLIRSIINFKSHWRLMYDKTQGTSNGYYLESHAAEDSDKRILGIVNGQYLGLKEPLDYNSYRWKFIPVDAPKPDVDGSVSVIENPGNNKVHIKGWANTSRVDVTVGNTSYQISLNNPKYEKKEFDDVHTLSSNITGTQQVTVKAVDASETNRKKDIGSGQVKQISYDPEGYVQTIGISYNRFEVGGEVYDKDDLNASIEVKGYIYDKNGKLYMEFNAFTNKDTHKFYREFDIPVPEGHKDNYIVRINAVNIGGETKEVAIMKPDWNFTIQSPIKPINEVRIAKENNTEGIPSKQFVDVYKENLREKTYYVKYFNCDYIHENQQGQQMEGWIQKTSVEDFACLKGTSIQKHTAYPDADIKHSTPIKTRLNNIEVISAGQVQAIIARNDTYGTYLIRYYSNSDDKIRKDRWDYQSNYARVELLKPTGQWIDIYHLK